MRDLVRSGTLAVGLAISLLVVLVTGATAAAVRTGSRASGSGPTAGVPHGWVRVVDRTVGFTAWLPSAPKDGPPSPTADGLILTVARASHRIAIARIAIPDSAAGDLTQAFRGAIDALAWGAGFQVQSEGPTTFRGEQARQGLYVTDTGTYYRAMIFVAGAGDLYLIASPARVFKAVTTNFRRLP
jgi:hypothetical protein